ncbi:MAG: hypothetical protein EPO06_11930 [Burkholderiaceae bacterium]|nr:MAG: hypothetical protein EPO06_11930 [Burkholderiaceae bacterium]
MSTPEWLVDEVAAVTLLAVDGEADEVTNRLERIASEGGFPAMFGACYAWATAAGIMFGMTAAVESTTDGMLTVSSTDGQPLDETSPETFAARFVACVVNGDRDMAYALFSASTDGPDDYHERCVISVIAMMAEAGRHKLAQNAAGDG